MSIVTLAVIAALTGIVGWAVLRPFQLGVATSLQRLADPLQDERVALLRRLRDLDEDHGAGRLDPAEYATVRAETEGRAVAVLRALDARERTGELTTGLRELQPTGSPRPQVTRRPTRLLAAVLSAVAVAAVPVWFLAHSSAPRDPGETITGGLAGNGPGADGQPLSSYERRVRAHPGDVAARLDLAQRYVDASRLGDATRQYLAALKLDPENAEGHTGIGLLLFREGLANEGLASVNKALAVDPQYPDARYAKGLIELMGLHQRAAGVTALKAYLALAPFGSHRDTVESLLGLVREGKL